MGLKKTLKFLKLNETNVSMVLGALVFLVVVVFGFNYFRSPKGQTTPTAATTQVQITPTPTEGTVPANLPQSIKVEKGQTLWSIAEKYYGSGYNWADIAKENKLNNPGMIAEGQELTLPQTEAKKVTLNTTPAISPAQSTAIEGENYTVVRGDSLWKIAVRAYGDGYQWVKIWRANKVIINNHPNLIYPGQSLTIPRQNTK